MARRRHGPAGCLAARGSPASPAGCCTWTGACPGSRTSPARPADKRGREGWQEANEVACLVCLVGVDAPSEQTHMPKQQRQLHLNLPRQPASPPTVSRGLHPPAASAENRAGSSKRLPPCPPLPPPSPLPKPGDECVDGFDDNVLCPQAAGQARRGALGRERVGLARILGNTAQPPGSSTSKASVQITGVRDAVISDQRAAAAAAAAAPLSPASAAMRSAQGAWRPWLASFCHNCAWRA